MHKPYIIVAPHAQFIPTSAGIRGLYLFAEHLKQSGERATVVTPGQYHHEMPDNNHIVVYPDCFGGNIYGAKNVVRFLFMYAGYFGQDKDFPESEYMYYYLPDYILNGRNPDNICTVPMMLEERFPYKPPHERFGDCYLALKHHNYFGKQCFGLHEGMLAIDRHMDLAELFSRVRTLYTFDNSLINMEAAFAGIDVVPMYSETFKELYRHFDYKNPRESYGRLKALYFNEQLGQFISRTQEHFR